MRGVQLEIGTIRDVYCDLMLCGVCARVTLEMRAMGMGCACARASVWHNSSSLRSGLGANTAYEYIHLWCAIRDELCYCMENGARSDVGHLFGICRSRCALRVYCEHFYSITIIGLSSSISSTFSHLNKHLTETNTLSIWQWRRRNGNVMLSPKLSAPHFLGVFCVPPPPLPLPFARIGHRIDIAHTRSPSNSKKLSVPSIHLYNIDRLRFT